jgi:FMN phosphatase YigB (HAD superfamily)
MRVFWQRLLIAIFLTLFFSCRSVAPLQTGIRTSSEMLTVLEQCCPGTLVVFDLDNTLIEPVGQLGSDQWFYHLCDLGKKRGMSESESIAWAMKRFNEEQKRIAVHSVDPTSPAVLAELHRRGLSYFGLTARDIAAAQQTRQQLTAAGFDLSQGFVFNHGEALSPGLDYQAGIFYNGETGLSKGAALVKILKASGPLPRRVIFVDDKEKHVQTVDSALRELGIEHLCLRFSRADAKVAALPEALDEARRLLKGE